MQIPPEVTIPSWFHVSDGLKITSPAIVNVSLSWSSRETPTQHDTMSRVMNRSIHSFFSSFCHDWHETKTIQSAVHLFQSSTSCRHLWPSNPTACCMHTFFRTMHSCLGWDDCLLIQHQECAIHVFNLIIIQQSKEEENLIQRIAQNLLWNWITCKTSSYYYCGHKDPPLFFYGVSLWSFHSIRERLQTTAADCICFGSCHHEHRSRES